MVVTVTGTNVELRSRFQRPGLAFRSWLASVAVHCRLHPSEPSRARKTGMCNELFERIRGFDIVFVADESKFG